jgi:hypothetical protein
VIYRDCIRRGTCEPSRRAADLDPSILMLQEGHGGVLPDCLAAVKVASIPKGAAWRPKWSEDAGYRGASLSSERQDASRRRPGMGRDSGSDSHPNPESLEASPARFRWSGLAFPDITDRAPGTARRTGLSVEGKGR